MAAIRNARDIILQAAATRLLPVSLPPNVTVEPTNLSAAITAIMDAAAGNASAALAGIDIIVSDAILSAAEKPAIRKEWDIIASEKAILEAQATTYGITTEKTTYTAGFQALANYLNAGVTWSSGVPSWVSDANLGGNTDIVGATFRDAFKTYYDGKVSLIKKVTDIANTDIGIAAGNASAALAGIDIIVSDAILSAAEKPAIRKEWNIIASEKAILEAQATTYGITTEKTTYTAGFLALANYLNAGVTWSSGVPSWISDANLGSNTVITGATFRNTFKTYYDGKVSLVKKVTDVANANTNAASANASAALAGIDIIVSDAVLSAAEKPAIRKEWNIIASEKAILEAQGATYGITTEKTTYTAGFQALANYLNAGVAWSSGVPSWISDANLGSNTVITGATFRNTFKTYYDGKVSLVKKVTDAIKNNINIVEVNSKQINANLAPGLLKWTHNGANWIYTAAYWAADGTTLVIPSGSNGQPSSVAISSTAKPVLAQNTTYTLSFKANGAGRTLTVDLYPDTLPQNEVVLTEILETYTFQWISASADIINASLRFWGDAVAQQIHIGDIKLEQGSVRTPWTPHVGDLAGINNPITPVNYQQFVDSNAFSVLGFSQNQTVHAVSVSTSVSVNSDGQPVVILFGGWMSTRSLGSGGTTRLKLWLTVNGATAFYEDVDRLANLSTESQQVSALQAIMVQPPSGSVLYSLSAYIYTTGTGSGELVGWPTLQIMGLKR